MTQAEEHGEGGSAIDTLVLILDREISELRTLHFRMAELRLLLLDGNTNFVQRASQDVELASHAVSALEAPKLEAFKSASRQLGSVGTDGLEGIIEAAPSSHRSVLRRLTNELVHLSTAVTVVRDSITALAEDGLSSVRELIDLSDGAAAEADRAADSPAHLFVGDL